MPRHTTGLAAADGVHLLSPGDQLTSAKEKASNWLHMKCYHRKELCIWPHFQCDKGPFVNKRHLVRSSISGHACWTDRFVPIFN
jgi:hypothetical protein